MAPTGCRPAAHSLRALVNQGDYRYVVTSQYTQDTGPYNTGTPNPYQFPVYAWLKGDPAMKLVVKDNLASPQPDYVFKVTGKLDPSACKPEKRPEVPGEEPIE